MPEEITTNTEMVPNKIRFREFAYLFRKVFEELREPQQFLSPRRSLALFYNGLRYLRGITRRIETEENKIEAELGVTLLFKIHKNGLAIGYSIDVPVQTVIFPQKARLRFYTPENAKNQKIKHQNTKFQFRATTTSFIESKGPNLDLYIPNQGYADASGERHRFKDGNPALISQYGGIFIDGSKIQLLNYDELQQMKKKKLKGKQILMGANWYMDSSNQVLVLSTSEHQIRKAYNAIGIARTKDGKTQYFHICCHDSRKVARKEFNLFDTNINNDNVLLTSVAAMINVLSRKMEWQDWRLCGLEYNGGGLNFGKETELTTQPHFTVKF